MTVDDVAIIMQDAFFHIIKLGGPILLVSLTIGLLVSIFQTVTSIQEQTLTFVPKVLGVFLTLILIGHWMLTQLTDYISTLWADFTVYIK